MKYYIKEKQLGDYIIVNFNKIFPNYLLTKREFRLPNNDRIDILAYEPDTKKDVVIELKTGKKSPNNQLLAYSTYFFDPILIGIVGDEFANHQEGIQYINHTEIFQKTA